MSTAGATLDSYRKACVTVELLDLQTNREKVDDGRTCNVQARVAEQGKMLCDAPG